MQYFNIASATCREILPSMELWQFVVDKGITALASQATPAQDNCKFFLMSTEGTVRIVYLENSGVYRFICHLPRFWDHTIVVDIGPHGGFFYSHNPFDDPTIFNSVVAPIISSMEIASFPRALYGLLYMDSIVGLLFRSDYDPQKNPVTPPDVTTYTYLIDNPGVQQIFPFVNECDIAAWWRSFWGYYYNEQIIRLCGRIEAPPYSPPAIMAGESNDVAWMRVRALHPLQPQPNSSWDERYYGWDPQRQSFFAPSQPFPETSPFDKYPIYPLSWLYLKSTYTHAVT